MILNIKLHKVIESVTSKSGLLIINAILEGNRDGEKLWDLCKDYIDNKKKADVIMSLQGNYSPEYLFGIKQALGMWHQYQVLQEQCD